MRSPITCVLGSDIISAVSRTTNFQTIISTRAAGLFEFKESINGITGYNKTKKKAFLSELVDNYTEVASFGTLRLYEATYRLGNVYEEFARTWADQEIVNRDDNKKILAQKKVYQEAADLFEKEKTELSFYNQQTSQSQAAEIIVRGRIEPACELVAPNQTMKVTESIENARVQVDPMRGTLQIENL